MNKWLKRLSNWFLQIENEVMVPFVLVGIYMIWRSGKQTKYKI